jgi:hypothetical protein
LAWKQGRPGYGPHLIDSLGRVTKRRNDRPLPPAGEPGTITAIVADFLDSDEFDELRPGKCLIHLAFALRMVIQS